MQTAGEPNRQTPADAPVMVVVGVRRALDDKALVVVKQALVIRDGQISLEGPPLSTEVEAARLVV